MGFPEVDLLKSVSRGKQETRLTQTWEILQQRTDYQLSHARCSTVPLQWAGCAEIGHSGHSCALPLSEGALAGACFPLGRPRRTQLGRLIDRTQVPVTEEAGEGLTEQSRLGPEGGWRAGCAAPADPHPLNLGLYRAPGGVRYPGLSVPKESLGQHVGPAG